MKRGETFLPEGFCLTDATMQWLAGKFPTVDVEETIERFTDNAAAKAWAYRDWQAAFRNYIRNGQKYGGVSYKQGVQQDPLWKPVLAEAARFGFRKPDPMETPRSYRTALDAWKRRPQHMADTINIVGLGNVLKKVG